MNKKGSAIVESVMIFPLVVMSITALILIMTYFYAQLEKRVDMHIALRAESGQVTQNMYYVNVNDEDFAIYRKTHQVYSEDSVDIEQKFIMKSRKKDIAARKYLIDEAKFVRMTGITADKGD